MKLKFWIGMMIVFLVSCGAWGSYVLSRRAFLRDFNAGIHAYLAGNYAEAEAGLKKALERYPKNNQARQLLTKVLIERSFALYHQKDFTGALATLEQAAQSAPNDDETQHSLMALRQQLTASSDERPVRIEQVLQGLYRQLPAESQPNSLQAVIEKSFARSQKNQEVLLRRFWENQERWLVQLQREKSQFKKILYGGLILFGILGILLSVALAGLLHAYFGRRGVFSRLLEEHYKRLVAALPAGTQVLLGPPVSLHQAPESQRMDFIEAEIVSGRHDAESARHLQSLLEEENPWVRARAAKILYRLDPKLSMEELKRLVADASSGTQVPGMWALSELGTSEALDLLVPLAYSPSREIQQGAIRSLLQLQTKENVPPDISLKLTKLLTEVRSRTGWVF